MLMSPLQHHVRCAPGKVGPPMASGNVRRRLAVGLAVVLVTVVAVMAAAGAWLLFGPVPQREPVAAPVAEGEPVADVVTRSILVLGVDGDGRALEGQRSDSILLARVGESTVDLVSFPRDLLVDVPACTGSAGESKLNSVYAAASDADGVDAGVRCLAGTLRDISGIRVDDYVVLNMSSVVELVDVLGGVTVCLDESEAAAGAVPGVVEVGCHRLNGTQAMAYARARKGSPTARTCHASSGSTRCWVLWRRRWARSIRCVICRPSCSWGRRCGSSPSPASA